MSQQNLPAVAFARRDFLKTVGVATVGLGWTAKELCQHPRCQ